MTLYTEDEQHEKQWRRRGKPLRGCIGIFRETEYGMAGRILTFQLHPWETSTNYAALVAARCNVDVQDMRRVLPPRLWMHPDELEPDAKEEDRNTFNHGAYPQRYKGFSVGAQDTWGWFRHLNTTAERAWDLVVFTDWHTIFREVCDTAKDGCMPDDVLAADIQQCALATFIDAHNTSYYVNSYTTKVNPTMDTVLQNLLEGVRRLNAEWQDREARLQEGPTGGAGPPSNVDARETEQASASAKRREDFKRTMQVLSRFETCFRRASWKSGSEMVFPLLFGHLAFMTHRCWKVFMRKSIYLAAEAWRREYGQLATQAQAPDTSITYTLPATGDVVLMPGWSEVKRGDDTLYIGPDGDEYETIEYAHHAFEAAKKSGANFSALTKALNNIKEGAAEEFAPAGVAALAEKAPRGVVLSQHDDWMHRGDHPILRDMSLYIYSIWVYRVELSLARATKDQEPAADHLSVHVDIPFDTSYTAGRTWTQRLATEPRIPKLEGFQYISIDANPETHYLMKSVILQPVYLPPADDISSQVLRYLEAYKRLCRAPQGHDAWPAQASGKGVPGPFERSWAMFCGEQEQVAARARQKCLLHDLGPWSTPSIWNTAEVEAELSQKRSARGKFSEDQGVEGGWSVGPPDLASIDLLSIQDYLALETTKTAANFDGISQARTTRPKREQKDDADVAEAPTFQEGGEDTGEGVAQVEGSDHRERQGLARLGENAQIAHRFDPAALAKILAFDTAERTQGCVK